MYSLPILFFMMLYGEYQTPERYLEPIGEFAISRYYSPVPEQRRYYSGSYTADKKMNCGKGSCLDTASGRILTRADEFKVIACPREYPFGTILNIQDVGDVTCEDRGKLITERKIDLWVGIGDRGINNLLTSKKKAGTKKVYKVIYK